MERSSDVLQVLLETCIMQFISLNTNNCAFEYKTSEDEARLWVPQMELNWELGDLSVLCRAATDLLHELRRIPDSPELQWFLSVAVPSPAMPNRHSALAKDS